MTDRMNLGREVERYVGYRSAEELEKEVRAVILSSNSSTVPAHVSLGHETSSSLNRTEGKLAMLKYLLQGLNYDSLVV